MIYLDHAATSYPKPQGVLDAMNHWFAAWGVSAARGAGSRCGEVAAAVAAVRASLGKRLGVPPTRVAFCSGATDGINGALRTVLKPGDRVVTTAFEHAAVARTLRNLQETQGIEVTVVPPGRDGTLPAARLLDAVETRRAQWLVFTHASNVTGLVLDAAAACRGARERGAHSLVDVCQTAGLLPVDVGADIAVGSGHKALLGPPGIGFVAVRPDVVLAPFRFGGTGWSPGGGDPRGDRQPSGWPGGMEAGTPNTPAIVGLGAALHHLSQLPDGEGAVLAHGLRWAADMEQALRGLQATLHGPPPGIARVPVVSFTLPDLDPAEAGLMLDAHGIHARVGHHCAPWIHDHLGTERSGTIRLSPGPESSPESIQAVVDALRLG